MVKNLLHEGLRVSESFSESDDLVVANADALEFASSLPTAFASLIITSPPYNLGKAYERRMSLRDYLAQQKPLIGQLARTLKSSGSLCWQVGNYVEDREIFPLDVFYYDFFKSEGFRLRNRIIWHFEHGLHCSQRFSGRYETLLWFTKSDEYVFNLDPVRVPAKYPGKLHFKGEKRGQPSGNPLGKNPSDLWTVVANDWERGIWNIPNVKANHPEKTIHPCQFPIELVERCVLALTNEGDWIYDPYCGVGSALIAAVKHKRRAVGTDRDAEYLAICRDRIRQFEDGTLKTRRLGKPIHTPSGREKVSQRPSSWDKQEGLL
jgi:adenine-specific DNA-methyltransferase